MKKSLSLLGAVLIGGVLSVPAFAASPYYFNGSAGVSSFGKIKVLVPVTNVEEAAISTKSGIALTGAVGRSFGNFRLEGEVAYQKNESDKIRMSMGTFPLTGDFSVISYMLNGYYDIKAGVVTPYLSAGLGVAQVSLNNVPDPPMVISETHSVFGYQLGAGVALPLTDNISLDARYRYSRTSTVNLSGTHGNIEIPASGFLLGVRVGL